MSPWPALVSLLALLLYFVVTINVGRARAKYGIPAPQMSGNLDFERAIRVQQNMLEQLIFSCLPYGSFAYISILCGDRA